MPGKLIEDLAEKLNVDIDGLSLTEAVRLLQRLEGNFDCFARSESGFCDQKECLFYKKCMELSTSTEG